MVDSVTKITHTYNIDTCHDAVQSSIKKINIHKKQKKKKKENEEHLLFYTWLTVVVVRCSIDRQFLSSHSTPSVRATAVHILNAILLAHTRQYSPCM